MPIIHWVTRRVASVMVYPLCLSPQTFPCLWIPDSVPTSLILIVLLSIEEIVRIVLLSILVFRSARYWVYYETEQEGGKA